MTRSTADNKRRAKIAYDRIVGDRIAFSGLLLSCHSRRSILGSSLFRACIDHGAAAAHLLMSDPQEFTGVAAMLLRPQIEKFLRAVFFSDPNETTDDEVIAFFEMDKFPKRVMADGRLRQPNTKELASIVTNSLSGIHRPVDGRNNETALNAMLQNLHGLVHGGNIVTRAHLSMGGGVGFKDPDKVIDLILRESVRLAEMSLFSVQMLLVKKDDFYYYEPDHVEAIIAWHEEFEP